MATELKDVLRVNTAEATILAGGIKQRMFAWATDTGKLIARDTTGYHKLPSEGTSTYFDELGVGYPAGHTITTGFKLEVNGDGKFTTASGDIDLDASGVSGDFGSGATFAINPATVSVNTGANTSGGITAGGQVRVQTDLNNYGYLQKENIYLLNGSNIFSLQNDTSNGFTITDGTDNIDLYLDTGLLLSDGTDTSTYRLDGLEIDTATGNIYLDETFGLYGTFTGGSYYMTDAGFNSTDNLAYITGTNSTNSISIGDGTDVATYGLSGVDIPLGSRCRIGGKDIVPAGGTAGQVLSKIDGADYNTQWVTGGGGSSNWTVNGANIYRNSNVGIYDTNPTRALSVKGTNNQWTAYFENANTLSYGVVIKAGVDSTSQILLCQTKDGSTAMKLRGDGFIEMKNYTSNPTTPASNTAGFYPKNDLPYFINDFGSVYRLGLWDEIGSNIASIKTSASDSLSQYVNTVTGITAGNGLEVGVLADGSSVINNNEANELVLKTNDTARLTFDGSNNNMALGVDPLSWDLSFNVLELDDGVSISADTTNHRLYLVQNTYYDGSNYKAIRSENASRFRMFNGALEFTGTKTTPTAGGNVTFDSFFRVTDTGSFLIGKTTGTENIGVSGASTASFERTTTDTNNAPGVLQVKRTTPGVSTAGFGGSLFFTVQDTSVTWNTAEIKGIRATAAGSGELAFFTTDGATGSAEQMRIDKDGQINTVELASSTTPASGFGSFYTKIDGKPYHKNDSGTETDLSGGGGGGGGLQEVFIFSAISHTATTNVPAHGTGAWQMAKIKSESACSFNTAIIGGNVGAGTLTIKRYNSSNVLQQTATATVAAISYDSTSVSLSGTVNVAAGDKVDCAYSNTATNFFIKCNGF